MTFFMGLFGVQAAVSDGRLAEAAVYGGTLARAFHQLRVESGAPCVLVIDDAQVRFLLHLFYFIVIFGLEPVQRHRRR